MDPSRTTRVFQLIALCVTATGCDIPSLNGDGDNPSPDGTFTANQCQVTPAADGSHLPELIEGASYGNWKVIDLDDVASVNLDNDPTNDEQFVCGDGSPYRFYVQFNQNASDLTVTLEGGGACFDYETCVGNGGTMHPYRLGGLTDSLMTNLGNPVVALFPHLGRIDNSVPTNKYNHVFFPYCTADVYAGDVTRTYPKLDDDGNPVSDAEGNPIETTVQHRGRRNMLAAQDWLESTFGNGKTGQMLVTGHSAGATGIPVSYSQIRESVDPLCGAAVLDSGPIFPPGGSQAQQIAGVKKIWGLGEATGTESNPIPSLIDQLDEELDTGENTLRKDLANINEGLSRTYPDDRFLVTAFQEDLVFSIFSFMGSGVVQREDTPEDIAAGVDVVDRVLGEWQNELLRLKTWIDKLPAKNFGYYVPVFRVDNCSHMAATSPWSMAHDPDYRQAGIDGRAHGYLRTDIGEEQLFYDLGWDENHEPTYFEVTRRMHLGDAIRTLLNPEKSIPKEWGELEPGQLTYQQDGNSDDNWYYLFDQPDGQQLITDKQAYIAERRLTCANIGTYRQPEPYVVIPPEERDVPTTVDGEGLFRITTGGAGIIQVAHPWQADVQILLNEEGELIDLPYGWGGPLQLDPRTQYLVKVITPGPMSVRISWW